MGTNVTYTDNTSDTNCTTTTINYTTTPDRVVYERDLRVVYERDLAERQRAHLDSVWHRSKTPSGPAWSPCMHEQCADCLGTFIKLNGGACMHMMSCNCSKCSGWC